MSLGLKLSPLKKIVQDFIQEDFISQIHNKSRSKLLTILNTSNRENKTHWSDFNLKFIW